MRVSMRRRMETGVVVASRMPACARMLDHDPAREFHPMLEKKASSYATDAAREAHTNLCCHSAVCLQAGLAIADLLPSAAFVSARQADP